MGVGGYNYFRANPETGEVEEWHEGYQSSAGHAMGLNPTPSYMIRVVPAEEWAEIQRKNAEIEAANAAEEAEWAAEEEKYQVWLAALPDKIEFVTLNKKQGEAEDSYGNYIVGLKRYFRKNMSAEGILADINANLMNYIE